MRKSTLLWLVLAAFCGTVLFHTSQKVHDEREKIATLNASISKEEESLRVLSAEWSYLNQPARLEKLAKTYLNIAPLKGSQFIKVEDIPLRSAVSETAAVTAPTTEEKPAVEKVTVKKPQVAALSPPKPPVKIHKPAAPAFLQKPAHPLTGPPATATNARSFSDVMKSLHTGIE